MQKILFDTRAWCLDVFPAMQQWYGNEGSSVQTSCVFHNSSDFKKYGNAASDDELGRYFKEGYGKYSKTELLALEKKYGMINLWNVVYSDRFLIHFPEEKIIAYLSFYFYAWEQILTKQRPQFVVSETVVGSWNYILYAMCPHFDVKYLGILFTKNTNRYFFTSEMLGDFSEMRHAFEELQERGLSAEEKEKALAYATEFSSNLKAPAYLKFYAAAPAIRNFFNLYRITINTVKDIRTKIRDAYDFKIDYRLNAYRRDLRRLYRIFYCKVFGVFEKPLPGEKFVLFPLHFQPEASTEICAAYFSDQYNVIVQVSRSLPFDHRLYVKEHYAVLGTKAIDFYKKVKALPNVRLIQPEIKVGELIHASSAVAVLTGTSGLEAIICRKPVIIFGHVFYDIYPQVYRVTNPEALPSLFYEAIYNHQIDERVWLNYISAYISVGHEGRLLGGNMTPELIALHCKNLLCEIKHNAGR
jgi:hypothetical protein